MPESRREAFMRRYGVINAPKASVNTHLPKGYRHKKKKNNLQKFVPDDWDEAKVSKKGSYVTLVQKEIPEIPEEISLREPKEVLDRFAGEQARAILELTAQAREASEPKPAEKYVIPKKAEDPFDVPWAKTYGARDRKTGKLLRGTRYVSPEKRQAISRHMRVVEWRKNPNPQCHYCKCFLVEGVYHPDGMTVDHVEPFWLVGDDGKKVISCAFCNDRKGGMSESEFMVLLRGVQRYPIPTFDEFVRQEMSKPPESEFRIPTIMEYVRELNAAS